MPPVRIKIIPFKELRQAYVIVRRFIEAESLARINALDCKIEKDLGMFGDDIDDMINKFIMQFDLMHDGFEFDAHFHSETELNGIGIVLANTIIILINLIITAINLLSINSINIEDRPKFFHPERQVTDLTFKQLLTLYIEKEYKAIDRISYKLAGAYAAGSEK